MNVPNIQGSMSKVEWRIANLYQVVVLKKCDFKLETFTVPQIKFAD